VTAEWLTLQANSLPNYVESLAQTALDAGCEQLQSDPGSPSQQAASPTSQSPPVEANDNTAQPEPLNSRRLPTMSWMTDA